MIVIMITDVNMLFWIDQSGSEILALVWSLSWAIALFTIFIHWTLGFENLSIVLICCFFRKKKKKKKEAKTKQIDLLTHKSCFSQLYKPMLGDFFESEQLGILVRESAKKGNS